MAKIPEFESRWMEYKIFASVEPGVLTLLAEASEKECAEKIHDYYEMRGIHCAIVKQEPKF